MPILLNMGSKMDHWVPMKLHPLTLEFSGGISDLETSFQEENTRASLPHNRAALVIAILFYSAFAILDELIMPGTKSFIWHIRFAVIDPFLIVIFLASYVRFFRRYVNLIMSIAAIVAGTGIIVMIIVAPSGVNYAYYAGLMLVFMWLYTLARISFLWATLTGWLLVALYETAAIWISPTPLVVLSSNNFFFVGSNIMGMIACYSLERYARRNFFLAWQIDGSRQLTMKVNLELEKQTKELQTVNESLEQEIAARKKAEEELYHASIHAPLTGLYNRRFIMGQLENKIKEYERTGSDFSVTIIDFDLFKKINDTYGHLAGDFVLKECAKLMLESVRPYDLTGRYGGEEYIIISDHVDLAQAETSIHRMLKNIREHVFEYTGQKLRITFSAGIASSQEIADNLSLNGLIEIADRRLYAAKNRGRNQICSALVGQEGDGLKKIQTD